MAARAQWKGFLKLSLVSCPVALYPATSADARVGFRQINRQTGNRLRQQMIDSGTGEVVEGDDKAKGYEVGKDQYILIEKDELEDLQVESARTIEITSFVPAAQIDPRYVDKPYYVAPDGQVGQEAFAVIRDAMRSKGVVGIGTVVLSSREHPIMLEAFGRGIRASTLRYPYEVRGEETYFEDIDDSKPKPDLLKLAATIVEGKVAKFNPDSFVDTYETAVVDLIRAKQAGIKKPAAKAAKKKANTANLMDALRASVERDTKKKAA